MHKKYAKFAKEAKRGVFNAFSVSYFAKVELTFETEKINAIFSESDKKMGCMI